MAANLVCANCSTPVTGGAPACSAQAVCRTCGQQLFYHIFPAAFARRELNAPGRIEVEGDASCFYHTGNQAVVTCDSCGRFLCALCDLDLDNRHLCPKCLDRAIRQTPEASVESQKVQYDTLALHLAIWPVFTFWLPIIAAPAALFLVIRHWKTPMSILPRTRVRLWIALLLSVLEIGAFAMAIVLLLWYAPRAAAGAQ